MSCKLAQMGPHQSPGCDYNQRQTMNHIVDTCPLTEFEDGLNLLHNADDDTVMWLESTATAAMVKSTNKMATPMTLSDLEGHSTLQAFINAIFIHLHSS